MNVEPDYNVEADNIMNTIGLLNLAEECISKLEIELKEKEAEKAHSLITEAAFGWQGSRDRYY